MISTQPFHFVVDGAGHDIPGRELASIIEAIHKAGAVRKLQHTAFTPHCLGNQERLGMWVVQARGVELVEFHIADPAAGAPGHGYTVSRSSVRVGGIAIRLAGAARGEDSEPGPEQFDMVVFQVQYVGAYARVSRQCQLAIGDQVYGNPAGHQGNVGARLGLGRQGGGNSVAGGIGRMDNAAVAMPALPCQVVLGLVIAGKGDAAVDQPVDALAAMLDRKPDSILVAEAAPGVEGVADVILKRVVVIQHGGNAALGPECCAAADIGLADDGDLQVLGQIQGNSEAGSTAADNQDIEFVGLWHRVVIAGHNVDVY